MPTFQCSSNTLIKATKIETKNKLLSQQSEPIRRTGCSPVGNQPKLIN